MKSLGILFSFIVVLMLTAVACQQVEPAQLVDLPPTTTAVSLPQSTPASSPSASSEPISTSPSATATITATLTTYTIQPGDTLLTIGRRFEVTVQELAETNDLPNDAIFAGQTLVIPEQVVEVTAVSPTNVPETTVTPTSQTNAESEAGDNDLGPTGRLELTHPQAMTVAESGVITVEIIADPELAEIGEHEPHVTGIIRVEASYVDGERAHYEQIIELFPLMAAELNAPAFDVFPSGGDNVRLPRVIGTNIPAVWTWDIIATTPGEEQIITLNLYKEAANENDIPILTNSISRKIHVASKSRWSQIVDGLADNVLLLLGTGGPLGLLLAILTYRSTKENERLKKEIAHHKRQQISDAEEESSSE